MLCVPIWCNDVVFYFLGPYLILGMVVWVLLLLMLVPMFNIFLKPLFFDDVFRFCIHLVERGVLPSTTGETGQSQPGAVREQQQWHRHRQQGQRQPDRAHRQSVQGLLITSLSLDSGVNVLWGFIAQQNIYNISLRNRELLLGLCVKPRRERLTVACTVISYFKFSGCCFLLIRDGVVVHSACIEMSGGGGERSVYRVAAINPEFFSSFF